MFSPTFVHVDPRLGGGSAPLPRRGAKETRTPDPLHAMEVRYQLRYSPNDGKRPTLDDRRSSLGCGPAASKRECIPESYRPSGFEPDPPASLAGVLPLHYCLHVAMCYTPHAIEPLQSRGT